MPEGYNFSLTTFTCCGKLGQIENALAAVAQGSTTIGIRATNGVVLVSEAKATSALAVGESMERICPNAPSVGMAYAGLSPDMRVLLKAARNEAEAYWLTFDEYPPTKVLVHKLASYVQEYTQSGGVRPFGVSLLVAGLDDEDGAGLFQVDPAGSFFAWKAVALARGVVGSKTFVEKRCTEPMELEDAIHTAILALKESFDGQMTESNIEIGVASKVEGSAEAAFRKLSLQQVREYLENL